jgi:hypothetical protein
MASSIKLKNANGKTLTIENSDTNTVDTTINIMNGVYAIDTVDDFDTVPDGITTVIVKDTNRGGDFYWDAVSVEADNGGTIFQVTGTTTGRWKRIYSGSVSVKWFGAKGDGIALDSSSIQNAINTLASFSSNSFNGYSGVYIGYSQELYFPQGRYVINSTITIGAYADMVGDNAILIPDASLGSSWAITGSGWLGKIDGIQFINFTNALYINVGNIDTGNTIIKNCTFSKNGVALKYNSVSSICTVEKCRFVENTVAIYNENCDRFFLQNSWLTDGVSINNYDAQIINHGYMVIQNILYVPLPQTALYTSLVNNYYSIEINKCRLGGESGNRTIINNYAEGFTDNINMINVSITDSSIFSTGGTPITLFKLPNNIVFTGNTGLKNQSYAIVYNSNIASLSSEITRIGYQLKIVCDMLSNNGLEVTSYLKLAPYISIFNNMVSYGFSNEIATNIISDTIKFRLNVTSVDSGEFARNAVYEIVIGLLGDTVGTTSKYLVKANYSGSDIAEIIPIIQGATTTAPVLFNNAGVLSVKTNGATSVQNYQYSITRTMSCLLVP